MPTGEALSVRKKRFVVCSTREAGHPTIGQWNGAITCHSDQQPLYEILKVFNNIHRYVWRAFDSFYLLVKAIQRANFCVILCVRACICASVKNEIGKQLCFLRLPNRKYQNLEFSNAVNS